MHYLRSSIILAVFAAIFWTISQAEAADFHSPRAAALGGAGHAGPMLNDAIYLNPSYAAFLPLVSVSVNYLSFAAPKPTRGESYFHGHHLNGSVQDGLTPLLQAGVGVTQTEDARMIHVGAAKAAIQRLGFGLGAKMHFPKDPNQKRTEDLTFSVTGAPSDSFQAALVIDNLLETRTGKARGFYREFVLGTKWNVDKILMIYFDPHFAPAVPGVSSFGHETGVEFPMMRDLFLRIGMFRNAKVPVESRYGRGYAMGFGWISPRFSMDYGLSRVVDGINFTTHEAGLTFYF